MLAHRKRLGHRRLHVAEAVGHFEKQRLAQHHLLGIAAGIGVGITDRLEPLRPHRDRHRDDAGAGLQRLRRIGPVIQDLGRELMAEDHVLGWIGPRRLPRARAQFQHVLERMDRVQVRSADAAGERLDQYLALAGHGIGHLVAHQLLVASHHGAHRRPSLSSASAREPPDHRQHGGAAVRVAQAI